NFLTGILLVFAFLIVPACCSFLFFNELRPRILLGWVLGLLASVLGIGASYFYDLPTGPMIVSVFGIALIVSFFIKRIVLKGNPIRNHAI
ncbi:MAG: metal ABC transporter permease, partial [Deltaproteobacteria bacterium]|nr:metal ABC transporter permease [Deltaproteobacteria bacterium]